ncbi:catabolic L-serine/threonine dehydratase [[Candida] jaroonii]|uniref:Catabolic L-serine/threonine dehydratase n=1 Tax=[Candida] jaroonii TaxID=467808 RepID=A0ACA9Y8B7_9ASCO|nr:catabolic L-serine/threonine dehydratase [[Candida] jaroonii]
MKYPAVKTSLVDVSSKFSTPFRILYKKESEQPSGSFKLRGIGHLIGNSIEESRALGKDKVEVFSSSGGNAGLAAAYSSRYYNVPCTVVLPNFGKPSVIEKLKEYGATVHLKGEHWGEADGYLRNEIIGNLDESTDAIYCHPFDDPLIWEGNSKLIAEIEQQLSESELSKVKGVICSVGGGGLFNGVVKGLKDSKNLKEVPVLAVETDGAPKFDEALKQNKVVTLDNIKTLATSLASPYISEQSLHNYHSHPVSNCVIPDLQSVKGCVDYFDTFGEVIEPACGASTSILTEGSNKKFLDHFGELKPEDIIIVIVCGGTVTTKEDLEGFRNLI